MRRISTHIKTALGSVILILAFQSHAKEVTLDGSSDKNFGISKALMIKQLSENEEMALYSAMSTIQLMEVKKAENEGKLDASDRNSKVYFDDMQSLMLARYDGLTFKALVDRSLQAWHWLAQDAINTYEQETGVLSRQLEQQAPDRQAVSQIQVVKFTEKVIALKEGGHDYHIGITIRNNSDKPVHLLTLGLFAQDPKNDFNKFLTPSGYNLLMYRDSRYFQRLIAKASWDLSRNPLKAGQTRTLQFKSGAIGHKVDWMNNSIVTVNSEFDVWKSLPIPVEKGTTTIYNYETGGALPTFRGAKETLTVDVLSWQDKDARKYAYSSVMETRHKGMIKAFELAIQGKLRELKYVGVPGVHDRLKK